MNYFNTCSGASNGEVPVLLIMLVLIDLWLNLAAYISNKHHMLLPLGFPPKFDILLAFLVTELGSHIVSGQYREIVSFSFKITLVVMLQ